LFEGRAAVELPDGSVAAEAQSGEAACQLYAELNPDVVVMDLGMPGMGGLEAARAVVDRELRTLVPRPTLEQLELMVSEIVTGAVPVAAERPDAPILLDLRIDHQICCAVITPGFALDGSSTGPSLPRGWALQLVAGLAHRWGVSRAGDYRRDDVRLIAQLTRGD